MQKKLLKHPDTPSPVTDVAVEAFRFEDGRVQFSFMAVGDLDRVVLARPGDAVRTDELWRHTCFEAFLANSEGEPYVELNFAPSGAWAAYAFDRHRSGMRRAEIDAPKIQSDRVGPMVTLRAEVALGPLSELLPWKDWRAGLTAVFEADDGDRSYWALSHPPGEPDFHNADCFVAKLAPDASL